MGRTGPGPACSPPPSSSHLRLVPLRSLMCMQCGHSSSNDQALFTVPNELPLGHPAGTEVDTPMEGQTRGRSWHVPWKQLRAVWMGQGYNLEGRAQTYISFRPLTVRTLGGGKDMDEGKPGQGTILPGSKDYFQHGGPTMGVSGSLLSFGCLYYLEIIYYPSLRPKSCVWDKDIEAE